MSPISDQEEAELCHARATHLRDVAARVTTADASKAMLDTACFWDFLADLADKRASKKAC